MARPRHLIVLLAASLVLAPPAQAHNAASAPEQYVRFLADCSDDWGGHSAVRDGHDLVALDLAERWLHGSAEEALFVLLTLGFGFAETGSQGGPLRGEVEITGPQGPLKVRLATQDNKVFTAESGAGLVVPDVILPTRPSLLPSGTQDGSRILVEFGFRYSSLGLKVGNVITAVKVQAFAREERGDYMPGGYYLLGVSSGGERECPQSGHQGSGDPGTLYVRRDYALRGVETPFFEPRLNTDGIAVSGNQTGYATLTVKNRLAKQSQAFDVRASLPASWRAQVEPPRQLLDPSGSADFAISVHAPSGTAANDSLELTIDSDLGGRGVRSVPLYWYPAGVQASLPATDKGGSSSDIGFILALSMLSLAVLRRRSGRDL